MHRLVPAPERIDRWTGIGLRCIRLAGMRNALRNTLRSERSSAYLPLYRTQRRWKDRPTVALDLPLFPGYLFVRIDRPKRVTVLQVPGVLSVIGGMGTQFNPLPEFEIEALRKGLDPLRAEPHPLLLTGQRVRICKGALAGIEGIVVRKKNNLRVVLTLDLIMQSVSLEVDEEDLEPMDFSPPSRARKDRDLRVGGFALET